MKILLIDPWGIGNTADYLNGLIFGLSRNTELTVITNSFFKCRDLNNSKVLIYRCFFKKSEKMRNGIIRKLLRGIEYAYTYQKILLFLKKNKQFDIIHINWLLFYKLDVYNLPRLKMFCGKLIYTAHNVTPHIDGNKKINILRKIYSYPDRIILHGEAVKQEFELIFPEYTSKIYIQKHGCNLNYDTSYTIRTIDPVLVKTVEQHKRVFISFGYIFYDKGVDRLIKMWNNDLNDSLMIIAGRSDEEYFEFNEAISNKHSSNLIILNKYIDCNTLNFLISRSNLIVLPYRRASMSGVVFTACDFFKPVMVTNVGSIKEYLTDEVDSFVVENNDLEILKKIKSIVFSVSNERLASMGIQLHDNLLRTCSWDIITERLIKECYEN